MRFLLLSILILPCLIFAKSKNGSAVSVKKYGYFFENRSGLVTIEMADIVGKKKRVIMKMRGFSAYEEGIDGKAFIYESVPSGTGFNLVTRVNGKNVSRISSRKGWGSWDNITAYLGGESIKVYENSRKSKLVRPLHLKSDLSKKDSVKRKKIDVNPYGLFYQSSDGSIEMEMAVFNKKNEKGLKDILLKLTGRGADAAKIDGRTMKYNAVHGGNGLNYTYKSQNKTRTRMITRKSWYWGIREVYLAGKSYKMHIDVKRSGGVRPLHLLTDYKKGR